MTNTTAAELYYLRHVRSCAAAAMGNKGGNPSPSTAVQISGADFIGRVLQSDEEDCDEADPLLHGAILCEDCDEADPLDRLLRSISQMVRYYAKIAMKLIIVSFAMLRDMLTWSTPLELAACLHLANAYMHRDLYTYCCESNHCRVCAVSAPFAQEIATIALALLVLSLSIIDWHGPPWGRSQLLLCRIRMDLACTAIAFVLPTLGKRAQVQRATSRKSSGRGSYHAGSWKCSATAV